MRREPEIRVEHGAHHFEGIPSEGEMVSNQQGGETDHARSHGADGIAVDFF